MRKLTLIILLAVASTAYAGLIGTLVKAEGITTVTGKFAWKCTYNVAGQYVTVIEDHYCDATMEFQ